MLLSRLLLSRDVASAPVSDTNITGTIYLIQRVGRDMRARGHGRILITGSIAGFIPGTYTAVYNGTKAFILMPGATETEFFERADMLDTKVGQATKDDPVDVARDGFQAMMRGRRSRRVERRRSDAC